MLVPSPDIEIGDRRKVKAWDARNFGRTFDPAKFPKELNACQVLVNSYEQALQFEKQSTRLATFIKQMSDIQSLSGQLANRLNSLRPDAKFFLDTVFDDDEIIFERLADLRAKLTGLPNPSTEDKGLLSHELESLRDFLKAYIPVLEKRLGANDGKFRRNSPVLWRAATRSPIWQLIGEAWELCLRYPHLAAKTRLSQAHTVIVLTIHEQVRPDSETAFKKPLKRYRTLRTKQRKLRESLKSASRAQKKALERELKEVEFRLHHEFYPGEKRS